MSLPLILRPEVVTDLESARIWHENRQPGLGLRFRKSMDEIIEAIERSPKMYAAGYRGVRKAMREPFQYIVYYRVLKTHIDVFAVMHASRRSWAWTSRLP